MNLTQVAEIELIYKSNGKTTDRPIVKKAEDACRILIDQWDENKIDFIEQAKLMLLNRAGRVLGICDISSGGLAGTFMEPRMIFVAALKANASSIIIAHNHPSANLNPSYEDKVMTRKLMEAGKLLDITVADSVIITSEGFYSFAEEMAFQKIERDGATHYEVLIPF